ncbi:phage associated protein [Neisseria animaloris]|uniref:pyocin activator PrtN family protein n=1 Tax=Neisseria animaloris TaxID=326522 RepID=UPI000A18FD87|nr:pyocin activator PrtN family protein [Neisseria animaloris]OSI06799.1 transcriptional regulator [Neisseria animaloris]VEH86531.1 phage associated protein [Neisseria animaloris]
MTTLPTHQRLLLIYGSTHIPLEKAIADWMPHINEHTARRRAKTQTLPWPVINSEPSQKTSMFVSISAIAEWLDKQEDEAKKEWQKMNH